MLGCHALPRVTVFILCTTGSRCRRRSGGGSVERILPFGMGKERAGGGAGVGMSTAEERNLLRQVSVSGNSVRCKICNYLFTGSIGWQKRRPPVEMMLNCRTDWQRAGERLPRALLHHAPAKGGADRGFRLSGGGLICFDEMELSRCTVRPATLAAAPGQNENKWR